MKRVRAQWAKYLKKIHVAASHKANHQYEELYAWKKHRNPQKRKENLKEQSCN